MPRFGVSLHSCARWFARAITAFVLLAMCLSAMPATAQSSPPLQFEDNIFVTGDYVVAGWYGKQVSASHAGYASGTIRFPDPIQASYVQAGVPTSVPLGADIVGAWIYWTTVEKSQSANAGQTAYLTVSGHPTYQLNAISLDQSAPVSWSSGGCTGNANGTTTMRVYRANVRAYLPVDSSGRIQPNMSYTLELADSGSNGNGAPFTLGATMVIIYRVLSPTFPLTAVVMYDGAFAPSNAGSTMGPLTLQGFYQPGTGPNGGNVIAKITHIVANGQAKKSETVYLNNSPLTSLYGKNAPAFPGLYNNSGNTLPEAWDNPTWNVANLLNAPPADNTDTTSVVPATSQGGCVSWGAVIFSTTVQDSDGDGLLDYWEEPPGPLNPVNPSGPTPGYVDVGTGQFVSLPGADPRNKNIFIQLDSMCSGNIVNNADYSSSCSTGMSLAPPADALAMMTNAFAAKGITLYYDQRNAIPVQTCTDNTTTSPPQYCSYPNQPGVVTWKDGYFFLKNQPLNLNADGTSWTETQCEQDALHCVRRFQSGRKDSYHYVVAANALGGVNWGMGGTLARVVVDSSGVATFTTTSPPAYDASTNPTGLSTDPSHPNNGRVSVIGAISAPTFNGVWFVLGASNVYTKVNGVAYYTFTAQTTGVPAGTYDITTDPGLGVVSGQGDTGSGWSDLGGDDSLVTLGLWGPDGQPTNVQAGTVMHELGHTLGLPHGGAYRDTLGSFALTLEGNCKSNYQSVMSYLFQIDLLDGTVLDYSEQALSTLNETSLPVGLTTTDNSALAFNTTKWYTPNAPGGVGSAAKVHCDGGLILPTDANSTMYRVDGPADPITPAWMNNWDINFNGNIDSSLRGYNDWASIDLRQMGATGSLSSIGGGTGSVFGAGGGTGSVFGAGGGTGSVFGAGGGTGSVFGAGGTGELTRAGANSVVRPPKSGSLMASPNDSRFTHSVTLSWNPPTFGQIAWYNVYRAVDGGGATLFFPASDGAQGVTGTSYTDSSVSPCHTYTYYVTSVLLDNTVQAGFRESVLSTSATYVDPCPPLNASSPSIAPAPVMVSWNPPSGPMASDVAAYNVYRATGITTKDSTACTMPANIPVDSAITLKVGSSVSGPSFTDTGASGAFANNTCYYYVITALYPDGCTGNQLCRESVDSNITATYIHFTVNPIITTLPTASAIVYGQQLQTYPLSGGVAVDPNTNTALAGMFTFQNPTFVPPAGSYAATVVFTPTDGYDYNTVTGFPVYVAVSKAATTTTITGTVANPNPPLLGQTITVNFKVAPAGATGSVTVTEDAGATCTGMVGADGTGSCSLILSVLTAGGKSAVGNRNLTAVYSGDSNYAQSSTTSPFVQQVIYRFTGFLSPLSGTGNYVGSLNLGKVLPIKWQLTNNTGTTFITMNNLNMLPNSPYVDVLLQAIYNGAAINGKCGLPSASGTTLTLFTPTTGVAWPGNSNFRYDPTNNQFIFNWDTSVNVSAGCYTLILVNDDGLPQPPSASSWPLYATSLQLK